MLSSFFSNFITDFFGTGYIQKLLITHAETLKEPVRITIGVLAALVIIVAAYLLGSLNFAIIISGKKYKQDIRQFGSKNAGMTNMMRTYGKTAAAFTLGGDALKAVVSCLIGYALLGQMGAYVAGLFCIIGHIFPIYYRFRGGKGVVTAGITILMCNPPVFLILITLFLIIVLFTRYISLGSVVCIMLYPIILDRIDRIFLGGSPYILFAFLIMLLVVFKHIENIKRLYRGEENKFSFKKSVKAPVDEEIVSDGDEGHTDTQKTKSKKKKKK